MTDMRYALYLGCTIPYRELSYEVSTRKVADALGIELVDMPDANCCGLPLEPANHAMMVRLAARNLCIAEEMGLDILSLCNGCTGVLRKVNRSLKAHRDEKAEINRTIDAGWEKTKRLKENKKRLEELDRIVKDIDSRKAMLEENKGECWSTYSKCNN